MKTGILGPPRLNLWLILAIGGKEQLLPKTCRCKSFALSRKLAGRKDQSSELPNRRYSGYFFRASGGSS